MFLFVRLLMLILLSSCANTISIKDNNVSIKHNDAWEHIAYDATVKTSEDWQVIAIRTEVPASILKRYNHSTTPLKTNQVIKIPTRSLYYAKNGETSLGIAVKYGMTFSEFINLNDLSEPYKVKKYQKLKVIEVSMPKAVISKSVKTKNLPVRLGKFTLNWPLMGKVTTKFGLDNNINNDGIKIKATMHNSVKAASDGIVVYVGNEIASYANLVMIQHSDEWLSSYGNLGKIDVQKGDNVKLGQIIGNLEIDTLYFGLRKSNVAVNPLRYLNKSTKRKH